MKRFKETNYEYIFKNTESKKGTYYFRGTVSGQFIEKSLKTNKIGLAKEEADKIRKEPEMAKRQKYSFDQLFDDLLDVQRPKSKGTYENTKYSIQHLRPWFNQHCPEIASFEKYYKKLWAKYKLDQQIETPGRLLQHDRRYLIQALRLGYTSGDVKRYFEGKDLELTIVKKALGRPPIDKNDILALLDWCKSEPKFYLQLLMAWTMGMRKSEILHLQKQEIDLIHKEINLDPFRIKTRMQRKVSIPVPASVFPLLKKAYDDAQGPYIFPRIIRNKPGRPVNWSQPQQDNKYFWKKAKKALGVVARFHDTRHVAITDQLAAGLPKGSASQIFGATPETIDQIYNHLKTETSQQFREICDAKLSLHTGTLKQ